MSGSSFSFQILLNEVIEAGRLFIAEEPRTFAEISAMLTALHPDTDIGAMRQAVRMMIPLVQVPNDKRWSYPGNPKFTLAEDWIGRPISQENNLREFVLRYLRAFGPASAADMQDWSGLKGLKTVFEQLRPELVTYRDEKKRELFDLPNIPIPPADTPAPVRFIPQLDNLIIGHKDRDRIIAYEYRAPIMGVNALGKITFLVDGFIRGACRVEVKKGTASLILEPFETVGKADRRALTEEGEKLLRFYEPAAKSYEVRFAD